MGKFSLPEARKHLRERGNFSRPRNSGLGLIISINTFRGCISFWKVRDKTKANNLGGVTKTCISPLLMPTLYLPTDLHEENCVVNLRGGQLLLSPAIKQ